MMRLYTAIIIFFLFLDPFLLYAEQPWEKINHQDEIEVFRRETAYGNIYEFRGIGLVKASIPKIIALITDTSLMPEWVNTCISAKVLEKNYDYDSFEKEVNEYYKIIYMVHTVRWPLKKRDYVFKAHLEYFPPQDGRREEIVVDSRNIEYEDVLPQPGKVRMPLMHSSMKPINMNDGGMAKTMVDFKIQMDPGGIIPKWVANLVSKNIPHMTIMRLREIVLREDYDKQIEKLIGYHVNRLHAKK